MEQQTPIFPNEAAQKPKRAIFPTLISEGIGGRGGGGGGKFPIYFVQDCSSVTWTPVVFLADFPLRRPCVTATPKTGYVNGGPVSISV